jgi:hypothetical protein
MSHNDSKRTALLKAVQVALGSADGVSLLLLAEAAGSAVDPSVAPRAAAVAVLASVGYPIANYSRSLRQVFIQFALSQLASLRYLTTGPTLQTPRGNWYSYRY